MTETATNPTLRELALAAGVSLKTASRVMNGEPYVAAATAERVHDAARRLGFRPNALARQFRSGARNTSVGLVTGDVANPFYARIARGAEMALRGHGVQLVSASSDEDEGRERTIVEDMLDRRFGALLVVSAGDDYGWLARERDRGVPVVFIDRAPASLPADSVVIDNAGGMEAAVDHLLDGGHRHVALVGDLTRLATHRERHDAFVAALARVPGTTASVRADSHDADAALAAVRDLLAERPAPTAFVTTNNRITVGALRAFADLTHPPALVGFDDFDLADVLKVSVVAHDPDEMGRLAAEVLLRRLAGDSSDYRRYVLPIRLVVRGSGERVPDLGR